MRDEFNAKKAQWENEKNAIGKVQKLRSDLEEANAQLEKAQREYDLEKAAQLQYGRIPELKKALEAEEQIANEGKARSLLRDKVTEEEIARIIERWTGIPVARLMEGEREKLLHLEDILHQRVVGQDEAVRLVSEAILRSRAGIADPNKPHRLLPVPGPHRRGQKPSWPRPWPRPCSTAKRTWCASTCPSIWRSSPCPGSSARLPDTWAMRRAAS